MSFARAPETRRPSGLPPILREANWLALAAPSLIFVAHAVYGAMLPQASLTLATLAALLCGASLASPRLRQELLGTRGLALPASLFALTILVALWSLTPFVPGGPHPVWAYLGISPGAATVDRSITSMEIVKLSALGCLFMIGVMTGGSDTRARLAVDAVLLLGATLALMSVFAFVGSLASAASRLEATFRSANTAATLFGVLLVLCLGPGLSRFRASHGGRGHIELAPYVGAALIFLFCLLMTASRGGFAAAAAGLAAFGVLQIVGGRAKVSRAVLAAFAVLIAVAVLLVAAGDLLLTRTFEQGWDLEGRRLVFERHWRAFRETPLMGYGLGTFDTVNRTLLDAGNMRDLWTVRAVHNVYLSWLEQGGLLAAIPMFGCIAAILVATLRNTLRRSRMTAILFALLAADVVILVHGVTDFALEMYSMAAFFSYLLGLQFRLAQGSSRR